MKHILFYGLIPFVPLLALLNTSNAERPLPESREPASITFCFPLIGQPCSPNGRRVDCFNQFPDEPGVCFCIQGTFTCG